MRVVKAEKLDKEFFKPKEFEEIEVVKSIIKDVRKNGDKAVRIYTKKFDRIGLKKFEITKKQIKQAYKNVDVDTIKAIKQAATNIRKFAKAQFKQFKSFEVKIDSNKIGQKVVAIEKVGCYVPGGRYPLPSSALMSIIPAKIAGVSEIIVCSPKIKDVTIVAADIAGADRIFNIGGIQAIAAMAYGTKTVPKVDKIVGPGNKYVTAAKKEVYGECGIDFLAGPSEVMIIADDSCDARFVAADLLAQAEHDTNAESILVTNSDKMIRNVKNELDKQLARLKTKEVAKIALAKNGMIIKVKNISDAVEIANKKSPEHLELQVRDKKIIGRLKNYGSLFIGKYTAEVFGDYCSGTNHILPTNGCSRYTAGLSVRDFVKLQTYQKVSKKGLARLKKIAAKMGEIEGLDGHRNSALVR